MARLSAQEFSTLSRYIYSIAGISLETGKEYLVESRLNPLLVAFGLASFSELYYQAKTDSSGELEKHIIDAISTNETFFFRDTTPFDLLKFKILPELIDVREKQANGKIPISIWSAACSTGQEVYSIAISLMEFLPQPERFEINILGTDISQQAISQASYGKYNKLEIGRGLSQEHLQKYFHPTAGGWRVKDSLRAMATFKTLNLMHPFGLIGTFDIVFCRNVAIYFSLADKKKLFTRMARVLRPPGYLILGGSETLTGLAPQFVSQHYLRGMYYQLQGDSQSPQSVAKITMHPQQPAKHSVKAPRAGGPAHSAPLSSPASSQGPKALPSKTAAGQSDRAQPQAQFQAEGSETSPPPQPRHTALEPRTNAAPKSSLLQSLNTAHNRDPEKKTSTGGVADSSGGSLLSALRQKKKSRS